MRLSSVPTSQVESFLLRGLIESHFLIHRKKNECQPQGSMGQFTGASILGRGSSVVEN